MATPRAAPRKRKSAGEEVVPDPKRASPSMGLTEAVLDVIDILQRRPTSRGKSPDNWGRIVSIIAKLDCLPDSQVIVIEKAIAEAYCGWSDAQRRSIWYQTESGMTDDDSLCDTSFNGTGYALQVEMLDEVTRAAWQHAKELKKTAAKRPRRKKATK